MEAILSGYSHCYIALCLLAVFIWPHFTLLYSDPRLSPYSCFHLLQLLLCLVNSCSPTQTPSHSLHANKTRPLGMTSRLAQLFLDHHQQQNIGFIVGNICQLSTADIVLNTSGYYRQLCRILISGCH